MSSVVTRLSELMSENGDDQSSLARKIGCTPAAINQILTGRTQRSRLLPEIADHYDVALPYLLGRWAERGQGNKGERTLSPDERRLINLTGRLDPQDRALVYALVARLSGAPPLVSESVPDLGPATTLHEAQRGFRAKEEGMT
jgi:transcriptional regulator with XRE-family HTH domain